MRMMPHPERERIKKKNIEMENARCGHCLIVEKLGLPVWKKGTKT